MNFYKGINWVVMTVSFTSERHREISFFNQLSHKVFSLENMRGSLVTFEDGSGAKILLICISEEYDAMVHARFVHVLNLLPNRVLQPRFLPWCENPATQNRTWWTRQLFRSHEGKGRFNRFQVLGWLNFRPETGDLIDRIKALFSWRYLVVFSPLA